MAKTRKQLEDALRSARQLEQKYAREYARTGSPSDGAKNDRWLREVMRLQSELNNFGSRRASHRPTPPARSTKETKGCAGKLGEAVGGLLFWLIVIALGIKYC